MKASIYILVAFALAILLGTMFGHWANRHVKPLNPIEAEAMR